MEMNYFELNLNCIKKNMPLLYQQLREYDFNTKDEKLEEIESVKAKDGDLILKAISQSKEYRLNSNYHPKEEARRWLQQYNFLNQMLVITLFGLGNGIFAKAIAEKLKDSDKLLIYEPSSNIFQHVLYHYDLTSLIESEKVLIYVEGINAQTFDLELKKSLNVSNYKNQINCCHPQYGNIFQEAYKKHLNLIKESNLYMVRNINTEIYFSKIFIENILKNIEFLKDSISLNDLKKIVPTTIPAIVIAAGPSVETNINYIKQMKGKAILFAVDRILDYLLECGVEPDFVITIDPKKDVKYFTHRTDVKVPLICYMESNYEILKVHSGKKIICSKNKFTDEFYKLNNKPVPYVIPSGSVALVAFSVCIELGFHQIILVGQDLAYDGEKSHSGNTIEINNLQRDVLVESVDNQMIRSRSDWKSFILRYQDIIKVTPNIEVIDAKTKGAKIPGTINMELKDAIDRYCNKTSAFEITTLEKINSFNGKDLSVIYDYFVKSRNELHVMKKKADTAIKACNSYLHNKYNENKTVKYFNELKDISKYMEDSPLYSLLDFNIAAVVADEMSGIYQFTDNVIDNDTKIIKKSQKVYEAVLSTIDYIQPLFDSVYELISRDFIREDV